MSSKLHDMDVNTLCREAEQTRSRSNAAIFPPTTDPALIEFE